MLMEETFRRVMLAAQTRLGKETSKSLPLESMLSDEVMFATWVLKVFRRLLLLMFNVPTVIKLIPSRVLKKVLVITTLVALEIVAGKVREDRAGSADQLMLSTDWSSLIVRVDSRVKLNNWKDLPMEPIEVLPRLVNWPAFSQIKLPVIC